jgi:hypothetical protein
MNKVVRDNDILTRFAVRLSLPTYHALMESLDFCTELKNFFFYSSSYATWWESAKTNSTIMVAQVSKYDGFISTAGVHGSSFHTTPTSRT